MWVWWTLVGRQQFADKRLQIEADLVIEAEQKKRNQDDLELKQLEAKRQKKKKAKRHLGSAAAKLSFADEEAEEEEAQEATKFGKFGKNPTVKTDFLPDRDRDIEETREAIRLKAEYKDAIKVKMESEFTIHVMYWQPRGLMMQDVKKNKHTMVCKYGETVGSVLQRFRDEHYRKYTELKNVAGEQCLYAKEGLIIPHHFTWFELLQRGCTIFGKNVFADVDQKPRDWDGPSLEGGGEGESEEEREKRFKELKKKEVAESLKLYSHLEIGGILDRRWFDRNRKDFPMVKWEVYNPRKDYRVAFVGDPGPSIVNVNHVS